MSSSPTIAAVASGWGHSRRGLVRVSGPDVPAILTDLCRPVPTRAWSITATGFRLTDTLDLPAQVLRYDAPRSFTGEHAADLIVPGNPLILERVMARLTALPGRGGVREAEPGEFSARAYLNGKLTLDQAEGVAATIAAQNEAQLAAAESLLAGRDGTTYRSWTDALATLLALVEAGIDFTDQEDVVPIAPAELARRIHDLLTDIRAQLGGARGLEQPSHSPRAVLIGPPNAGKSTLFNALLGRRRAVVSPIAGTTRDALVETLDLSRDDPTHPGLTIALIDLPGLDPSAGGGGMIDSQAQARAHDEIARADIYLLCLPLPEGGGGGWVHSALGAKPTIRIRTKADLPAPHSAQPDNAIPICALDGWNLPVLRRALADAACSDNDPAGRYLVPRHRRALAAAAGRLAAAATLVDPDRHALASPETVATELRAALDALAELTGDISPDDIIGRIFATFCVGK